MGCSPGKHQPQDIEGDSMTLSPLSAQHINTETGERISEFYFHQQPWDKSFTRTDATVTKTYTRSEFLDERTPQYRPDIDGLRAVAVLAVVVYHLNSSWLPTGLVGVDIFFTISGFVVTSSLWGHLEDDEGVCAFCTDFFARRAKRLLPTALIVISSTALALALVAPQWDPRAERFLLVGLSGTFANANNWLVYERDDYMDFFSNDVHDYNPFLHLWSLGVEEQFYLVVPWLLYVCLHSLDRGTGPRTAIFWILSVISIALGWWVEVIGLPYYAFYLLPARFWELAAGVILFLFCAKKDTVISDMLRRQPTLLLLLQSWTALLFLVAFLVKFEEKSFPLPGALMPVIGTVCFILCGFAPFSLLNKLLSVGPMVFIGRISYCIYLWHVPVLSLCRWLTLGSEMPMALRLFTLLPTSLLAIATHFFVEAPLRKLQMSSRWALITSFIASIGAALFLVLLLVIRHSLGDSYFLWLACVALMSLLVIFVLFSCQTEERPGSRNLFMFICILVCAAFGLTYNIYHDNAGLHSAQQVMVNPRAEAERSVAPAAVQSSCTVCSCASETLTYHLPPESCTPHAWSCDRPQVPCFQGTPLAESDFQPHVPWGHENCLGAAMSEDEILARCLVPEQKRTIWLIGDSHSFALVPCISMTADALGIPVHNYSWPAHHACDMDWSKIFNVLEVRVNPGDIVAFSTCFYCMEWCLPHFEELIQRLVAFVGVKNAKLLIFKDVPLLNHNSVNCANSNPAAPTECSISAEQATVDVKEADDMLAAAAVFPLRYSKDFGMIDLFSPMCMEGRCDIFVPGTSAVAYVDKTHINLNGCHYLAPFICSGMRSLGYI